LSEFPNDIIEDVLEDINEALNMAITFVDSESNLTFSAGTSNTVNIPTHSDGDLLLLFANIKGGSTQVINTPSGWTELSSSPNSPSSASFSFELAVFYKIASSEPSNVTVTWVTSVDQTTCVCASYNGCDGSAPISNSNSDAAFDMVHTPPSVTLTRAGSKCVAVMGTEGYVTTITSPSGYTVDLEGSATFAVELTSLDVGAGVEQPGDWSTSENKQKVCYTIGLQPPVSSSGSGGSIGGTLMNVAVVDGEITTSTGSYDHAWTIAGNLTNGGVDSSGGLLIDTSSSIDHALTVGGLVTNISLTSAGKIAASTNSVDHYATIGGQLTNMGIDSAGRLCVVSAGTVDHNVIWGGKLTSMTLDSSGKLLVSTT